MNSEKRYKSFVAYIILVVCFCLPSVADAAEKTTYDGRMSIPLYNVITDTLLSMTPMVNDRRDDFLMQQVCALGDGKKKHNEVLNTLGVNGISIASLQKASEIKDLLQEDNTANQQTACTAWIASSLYDVVTTSTWYDVKKVVESVGKEETSSDWMFWKEKKVAKLNPEREIQELNVARFKNDVSVKMTIAQANAELYSIIANNLSNDGNNSLSSYRGRISTLIASYSPYYLNRVKALMANKSQNDFVFTSVTSNGFYVMNSGGIELLQEGGVSVLKIRGVEWLGNGKILGKEYFINVNTAN